MRVAPRVGERGLKSDRYLLSPSAAGRSPRRGAWIEILWTFIKVLTAQVAPRVGERGLKFGRVEILKLHGRRSPRRGAWIEIGSVSDPESVSTMVAPRVGERGLKLQTRTSAPYQGLSLPA